MRAASAWGASAAACGLANTSMPISSRSWPVSTMSCTCGASSDTSFTRSVPTDTQVPVESLKSSATRPLKITPCDGLAGFAGKPASPMR
ncbi:hypothetical protein D9M68_797380 [compost metagenome]